MRREIRLQRTDRLGTEEWLTHLWSEEQREIGAKDICSLAIPRTEIRAEDVNEGHDRAELRVGGEVWFAGVIEDIARNGDEKELIVESPERFAERAEPTGPVDEWDNAPDGEIITDAIEDVPELDVGRIDTTSTTTSLMFSHASQAYKARKTEDVSPGILRYNPDYTVDYGHLGRNKSHVTLSPRRDNVGVDFEIDRKAGYEQVTHLRLLGAGEGPHQITAEAVADDYVSGDPQIWKTYADKGIADEETLQNKADHYVEEMSTQLLDAELVVKGTHVELGDLFRVYVPTDGVDEVLEVVENKRVIDTGGIRHEVTLSNHRDTREDPEEKNRADLSHYNQAIEGSSTTINTSGGRQPVGPENNYELQLYYPSEVEYEHRLNVRVIGLPYRAYSAGAADNADFESAYRDDTIPDSDNLYLDQWVPLTSAQIPETAESSTLYLMTAFIVGDIGSRNSVEIEFRYLRNGEQIVPEVGGYRYWVAEYSGNFVQFIDPTDLAGDYITVEARLREGDPNSPTTIWSTHMVALAGKHVHDPDPGIIETFGDDFDPIMHYPTNCQVLVNGDPVGDVLPGSQFRWSDSVDVRGALDEGRINQIEVTSETLGHIMAFVEGDVYRQIRGRG